MNITQLADSKDAYTKKVFSFLASKAVQNHIAGDSITPVYRLNTRDCEELSQMQSEQIKANYIEHYGAFESPDEAHDRMFIKIAGDMLYNEQTGIGTFNDPTNYTKSSVPIMMGPYESTNIYSNGGLCGQIIDKKARSMVLQGATFKTYRQDFWSSGKIQRLEEAAEFTGFNDKVSDCITDAFVYGGSLIYPVFKGESPTSFLRDLDKLNLEVGCIDRWVTVDRWNITIVPSYIVTADDYLRPKTLFIPQGSIEINTNRCALVKPRPVPYWAILYNIGWSPSDFTGWLRSYYGYQIMSESLPVMAQQMSLLLYRMPLDGLNATVGPDQVKKLMDINSENMKNWSSLSPKAVNMVGEVEVVDRTYSGFEQFFGAMKSDLAAQCGIPEPSLWHTQNKGFSDNTQESLLKQSETLNMLRSYIERYMNPCRDALIAHVFGIESEEWKNKDTLELTFDKPMVQSEKDMAESGARFAASVSSFAQAGVSPDVAIKLAQPFFPAVKVTEDIINEAKKSYDEALKNQQTLGAGQGHTAVSTGVNTGRGTKA